MNKGRHMIICVKWAYRLRQIGWYRKSIFTPVPADNFIVWDRSFLYENTSESMKNKPAPLLNPAAMEPMSAGGLAPVFCEELVKQ